LKISETISLDIESAVSPEPRTAKMVDKVTFKDVARAAGVSLATVSRVFNGNTRVSRELYERVTKAARHLGVNLQQEHAPATVAFVLSNREMLHDFHSRIFFGAHEYCKTHGADVLFLSFYYPAIAPWNELVLPKVLRRRDVAQAAILAGTNSENLLIALRQEGIPFATLGNNILDDIPAGAYHTVCTDDVQGAYEMTRYLQALGHKDIWFVGDVRLPWFSRCYAGYRRAMENAGRIPRLSGFTSTDDREVGYLGTKAILSRNEPVTAIFAGTDTAAQGVYAALADGHLNVPQDVSVVGCNDTSAGLLSPPLTTIREFPEQLGRQLAELALGQISRNEDAPRQITIPTEIVKRKSCQPPPAKNLREDSDARVPEVIASDRAGQDG
jgi:DNA-binding LacI/PurR family transcriptional regulator